MYMFIYLCLLQWTFESFYLSVSNSAEARCDGMNDWRGGRGDKREKCRLSCGLNDGFGRFRVSEELRMVEWEGGFQENLRRLMDW